MGILDILKQLPPDSRGQYGPSIYGAVVFMRELMRTDATIRQEYAVRYGTRGVDALNDLTRLELEQ